MTLREARETAKATSDAAIETLTPPEVNRLRSFVIEAIEDKKDDDNGPDKYPPAPNIATRAITADHPGAFKSLKEGYHPFFLGARGTLLAGGAEVAGLWKTKFTFAGNSARVDPTGAVDGNSTGALAALRKGLGAGNSLAGRTTLISCSSATAALGVSCLPPGSTHDPSTVL